MVFSDQRSVKFGDRFEALSENQRASVIVGRFSLVVSRSEAPKQSHRRKGVAPPTVASVVASPDLSGRGSLLA